MGYNHHYHMYDLCKKHMHAYVLAEVEDGSQIDGIITDVDDDNVYLAIPIGPEAYGSHHGGPGMMHHNYRGDEDPRIFGFGGYGGYGGYGYPGYGYGYPHRPRRFNRLIIPLAALTAISLLPWY